MWPSVTRPRWVAWIGHVAQDRTGTEDAVVAAELEGADVLVADGEERLSDIDATVGRDRAGRGGVRHDRDGTADVIGPLAGTELGHQGIGQQAVADGAAAVLTAAAQALTSQGQTADCFVTAIGKGVEGIDEATHVDGPVARRQLDGIGAAGSGQQRQGQETDTPGTLDAGLHCHGCVSSGMGMNRFDTHGRRFVLHATRSTTRQVGGHRAGQCTPCGAANIRQDSGHRQDGGHQAGGGRCKARVEDTTSPQGSHRSH